MKVEFTIALLLLLLLGLALPPTISCQEDRTFAEAAIQAKRSRKAIEELKNGVLIVRLPVNSKKISELVRLSQSSKVEESRKKKLEKQLAATKKETLQKNKWLMDAFLSEYKFSDTRFMFDTSFYFFKAGKKEGYFLNKNMEVDSSIHLDEGPLYFVRLGHTDSSDGIGIEALVITDSSFVDMKSPFPYYAMVNGIGATVDGILNTKGAKRRSLFKMVAKLNKQLFKYRAKAAFQRG